MTLADFFRRRSIPGMIPALFRSLLPVKGGMRAYDLFALTVTLMIVGHADAYLANNEAWWHVPDRIVIPVFLVSIGYNSGRKHSRLLWIGAILMTCSNWILKRWIRLDILAMIILLRFIIGPVMNWAMKSRLRFLVLNLALLLLYPLTNRYGEYGSLGLIMAIAGWLNKNQSEIADNMPKPREYFIFSYLALLGWTAWDFRFNFSILQVLLIAAGMAWVMYLLYNFRQLLLNSVAARPKDVIEKICSFMGHKSLEIYVIHALVFQLLVGLTRIVS